MNSVANNISPLDDRYQKDVKELVPFFSEMGLMKYRIRIEIEYLIALSLEKMIKKLTPFSSSKQEDLRSLYKNFSEQDFLSIKKFEKETKHDVKSVEYYIRKKLTATGLEHYQEWVHIALTSEDVNNLSYALMWQDGVTLGYLPVLTKLHTELKKLAQRYRETPMLALTHGQPATPTSIGKEIAVFARRLNRQINQLRKHKIEGKLSGATGTWSAHVVAFPEVDWMNFSKRFISSLNLEPNLVTTQIESNDSLAESYFIISRINTILIDLCRDIWFYISRGIFGQQTKAGEVGSSTMPHKVNPINFENGEGNLGLANAYLSFLAFTLPVSRLQRDLSGSTVIRNQGVPLAHSLLACKSILKGLGRLTVNSDKIREELNEHWEVLAEAIQTILRKSGDQKPYERLKSFTRGHKITKKTIRSLIEELKLDETEKRILLSLTPETYIGLASKIVEEI